MGYSPYYIYILFKKYAKELVNQNPKSIFTSFGSFFSNKKGCDFIDKKLSENISKVSSNLKPIQTFLELFYITLKDICEEKLKL